MNRTRAIELSPIINAFANGFAIECKDLNDKWQEISEPVFANSCEYRIKPTKKLVPFTFEDNLLFRDKWVRTKGCIAVSRICWFGPKEICISDGPSYTYKSFLSNFEFEDGSPCGKYIEE